MFIRVSLQCLFCLRCSVGVFVRCSVDCVYVVVLIVLRCSVYLWLCCSGDVCVGCNVGCVYGVV